jgi:hypothetical protein
VPTVEAARPPQPPQQILQSEADMSELITSDVMQENLSLDDIVSQVCLRFQLYVLLPSSLLTGTIIDNRFFFTLTAEFRVFTADDLKT